MEYPDSKSERGVAVRNAWTTNVLLVPTVLGHGVSLRVTVARTGEGGQSEKALGIFDEMNTTDLWFIRSGVRINIYVEGAIENGSKGVAAVTVCGV